MAADPSTPDSDQRLRADLAELQASYVELRDQAAVLRVRNRELEVRVGQLEMALGTRRAVERWAVRIRANPSLRRVGKAGKRAIGR